MKTILAIFLISVFSISAFAQECEQNRPEYSYRTEDSPDYGKSYTVYYFAHIRVNSNKAFFSPIYKSTYVNKTNSTLQDQHSANSIIPGFIKAMKPHVSEEYHFRLDRSTSASSGISARACNDLAALKKSRAEWMNGYKQRTDEVIVLEDFQPEPYSYNYGDNTAEHILVE